MLTNILYVNIDEMCRMCKCSQETEKSIQKPASCCMYAQTVASNKLWIPFKSFLTFHIAESFALRVYWFYFAQAKNYYIWCILFLSFSSIFCSLPCYNCLVSFVLLYIFVNHQTKRRNEATTDWNGVVRARFSIYSYKTWITGMHCTP